MELEDLMHDENAAPFTAPVKTVRAPVLTPGGEAPRRMGFALGARTERCGGTTHGMGMQDIRGVRGHACRGDTGVHGLVSQHGIGERRRETLTGWASTPMRQRALRIRHPH